MKKLFTAIGLLVLATLLGYFGAGAGLALAASVNNYFQQTTPGTKDNVLVLNGTVKVEDVKVPAAIGFTVPAESGNAMVVALQFKDGAGSDMAAISTAPCYVASDATGDTPVSTFEAFNGLLTTGVDATGSVQVLGTNARLVISTNTGDADVVIQESSTTNYYLCCSLTFQGVTTCSGILDFN